MKTELGRTVSDMLQKCMPQEMIVLAVDMYVLALESTRHRVDETAEKRRVWDREYRRNRREHPPDTPDIHPTSAETTTSLSKEEECLSAKKERKQESKKERGCKLPPDWIPKFRHYEEGSKRGMNRDAVNDRAVAMRDWCDANANRSITTKANWDSAFMGTWIKGSNNGNAVSNHRTDSAAGRATAREAHHVATMGGAALRRLRESKSAGTGWKSSDSTGIAEVVDIGKRAESSG